MWEVESPFPDSVVNMHYPVRHIIVSSVVALLDIAPAVAPHIVWGRIGQADFFVYPVGWSLSAGIPAHTADRVGRADMFAVVVHSPAACSYQNMMTMKLLV